MRHNNRKTVVTIQSFSISSRHKHVIALPAIDDVISSSFKTAALLTGFLFIFIAVDLCSTVTKPLYCASSPIEETNGLTSNIPLLAVFAGTHPLVHINSVIRRMKMIIIDKDQKLLINTAAHTHMNSATQPPH
ncbi:hypothetical protein T09_1105 [Trichinella sp. T9]|nr:hypothetical protein T09_1105 [Trichinella sp. T9]